MAYDSSFYLNQLYPLQDEVLAVIRHQETGFYLTGGTAVSRVYCPQRFSDDLDFFVNDKPEFTLWGERVIAALSGQPQWLCSINQKEDRFMRLTVAQANLWLKIDMVNDVPAHVGQIQNHAVLGRVDSAENILANKLTAVIDRNEPKDFADIWTLTQLCGLSVYQAITDAQSKAAGIFPVALAQRFLSVTVEDWILVRWHVAPPVERFIADLHGLGEQLLLGNNPD
jgi:hypothetical protein